MSAIKGLLPKGDKPVHLNLLTGVPISTCQKMLCGAAGENVKVLRGALRSGDLDFAGAVLRAFVGDDAPIARSVSLQQQLRDAQRVIRQLKAQIAEAGE